MDRLRAVASSKGLAVIDRGNGHIQISGGPLLVNYYPTAKRRSAYVAGTTRCRMNVSPEEAVEMAFVAPNFAAVKDKRGKQKRTKIRLFNKHPFCHWCHAPLTLATATVEHIIPLDRGGLDNANNKTLACEPCNHKRGNNMPELDK